MNSSWSSYPPPVLWVKITLPQAADEEVKKYPGHCKAKIRPRACPAVPGAFHGMPMGYLASSTQPRAESHSNSETASRSSHFTEEETKTQNSWNCVCDTQLVRDRDMLLGPPPAACGHAGRVPRAVAEHVPRGLGQILSSVLLGSSGLFQVLC